MELMQNKIDHISERIHGLEQLRNELGGLVEIGTTLPNDIQMKSCICHVIQLDERKKDFVD